MKLPSTQNVEYGSEGFHSCCGGEVHANGHKSQCPARPGCCGKCRFKCLVSDRLGISDKP